MPLPTPDATDDPMDLRAYLGRFNSTFCSGRAGSALWLGTRNGQRYLFRSQGRTVIRSIQCALGVQSDGFWGPHTQEALRGRAAAVYGDRVPPIVNGRIDATTLLIALDLTINPSPGADDAIAMALPRGTVLPEWLWRPPADGPYGGLLWGAPMPVEPHLPPPQSHPNYGLPLCVQRGRVVELDEILVEPAAGLDVTGSAVKSKLRPLFPNVSPVQTGASDAPGPGALLFGGAALAALGALGVWIFDEED